MTRIAESRDGYSDLAVLWAMPSARALVLRIQSLRLFSLRASIAIAAFSIAYFGGQLLRGWL